ncbi:helix-turn-helix domain-containing protein [Paenibacillus wulumuqiensis]|uniref:helix-turn-helix domain-containing protein n=1 Tax=Paenibacillus wulumuqiensis TaxID=1567107 RepID=UPI00061985E9|nr:helix-turn-helix transcriptional regulator [Paenibacillus wulumuqiensis]
MQNTLNIRSIVEQEIQQKGYNLSRFSQVSGMNRGTLSLILNGNPSKLPSIPQMDKIAEALGYEQGWLYELYLEECFDREVPHWRRLKNFLYRCIQLNKEELIGKALHRLMEDCSQTAAVFDAAEEWYDAGHRQILLPFYHYVTMNEKYRHAERLAISHYRIFRLSQSENFENNLRAAITFEPYRHELPVGFRLDGLLKLANIYYNQHMWEKAEYFADELHELSTSAYDHRIHMINGIDEERGLQTERHLVVYYGQGYVMKGNSLFLQERYDEALEYIYKYENLNWFEGLGEEGRREVNKLSGFARANFLALHLLTGNNNRLSEYLDFLRNDINEVLPGLIFIVEAANKYNFIIDDIINEFLDTVTKMEEELQTKSGYYQSDVSMERYISLYKKLAIYFFKNRSYNKAIDNVIKCMNLSVRFKSKDGLIPSISLFEMYREHAASNQLEQYIQIMREVLRIEEAHFSKHIDSSSY